MWLYRNHSFLGLGSIRSQGTEGFVYIYICIGFKVHIYIYRATKSVSILYSVKDMVLHGTMHNIQICICIYTYIHIVIICTIFLFSIIYFHFWFVYLFIYIYVYIYIGFRV